MRAVLVSEFGGPEQLRMGRVADPVAGPGQVRVAVRAAGVNPVDAGNRADGGWAGLRVPCILGYDIAGVIDSVGPGVTGLAPGDRVMAMTHFPDGAGGYAELAVIDAALAAPISAATSFADAAATPLAAGTASLVLARLGLPPGSRLLVLGASGGVGLFLLQLAAAAGITTIGAGREVMHAQMRGLGAAACIDYTREDVAARAQALAGGPVDAIADLVGGSLAQAACPRCGPAGRSPRSPPRSWTWTRCSMPTSPSTACSSRTTATAPGRSPRCLTSASCGPSSATCSRSRRPLRHTGSWKTGTPAADRPRRHEQPWIRDMTAEQDAPRVVSASREIAAGAGRIFELIADPAAQPGWDGNDNLAAAPAGERVRGPVTCSR